MAEEDFAGYSPRSEDFEFHMTTDDDPALLSPADELFYKGKLLPLHLPPRLQMVEQLLANPPSADDAAGDEGTAYRSCNSSGTHSHSNSLPKKSWTKKLLNLKIKAPKSYLRSFFHKSRSSDEDLKTSKSMKRDQNEILEDDERVTKSSVSSSAAVATKSLSFSSTANTGGKSTLKRSSSVSSDAENSIQGAIAHCKKSQLEVDSAAARKSAGNVGFYLLSASKIAPDCEQSKKTEMMQFDFCF
ncbi:probable membrane-associated kinase regulator 4 [Zingiber officinale]|uniref:Membrane-associated kinase regulator 4 n=1 Tax=Zingiber officinale TaxID=94328 RepID=A0A8J5I2H1_ZINOF|nr:probable membrane-associated kinase regulator 4 [Zingiber officinale]KAG6526282.1 hypothetical protein ZIOFF_016264 [Zingiber officinale]